MVVFAELEGKYHNFLDIKIWDCKLNVLQWNYCKDLVLGAVETKFLEIGVYVSLKQVTAVVWEDRVYRIWVKIQQFLYVKTGDLDLKISLFNYSDDLVLHWAESHFLNIDVYLSLKQAPTGLWGVRLCWIWVKIPQFLSNIKTGEWNLKNSLFNYWNDLMLGWVETYFLEVGAYVCGTSHYRCLKGFVFAEFEW